MSARGGSTGPSMAGSLRLLAVAAVLVGGGTPAVLGTLQVLAAPEPPVRLAMLVATSTHRSVLGLAVVLLGPVRWLLLGAGVLLAGLVVLSRVAGVRSASAPAGGPAADSAPARSGAAARSPLSWSFHRSGQHSADRRSVDWEPAARPPGNRPAAGRPVVVVSAVTGTVGRTRFGGRAWTVRGTGGRLRDGHRYVVVARRGDVLEVTPAG